MPQLTKNQIQKLILEAVQELKAELHSKHHDDDKKGHEKNDPSDPRVDPPQIKDREGKMRDLLLGSSEEEGVEILELGAELEDGTPVCEGCLVAYMNEHKDLLTEAKYQGREVPLGKPMKGDVKKSKVYVRDPKTGNVKKVNFGDKKMRIKKSSPKHRKSFRARHHCENPGPRTKARYWSCRAWE
jgi:hypothetical protein